MEFQRFLVCLLATQATDCVSRRSCAIWQGDAQKLCIVKVIQKESTAICFFANSVTPAG